MRNTESNFHYCEVENRLIYKLNIMVEFVVLPTIKLIDSVCEVPHCKSLWIK